MAADENIVSFGEVKTHTGQRIGWERGMTRVVLTTRPYTSNGGLVKSPYWK
jgi:hypothetical protein